MPNPMGTLGSLGRGGITPAKRPASSATMTPRWTNEEGGVVKRGDTANGFYAAEDFCNRSQSQMAGGSKYYPGGGGGDYFSSDEQQQVTQQQTSSLKRPGSRMAGGVGIWGGDHPQGGGPQTVCDLDYCPDLIIQHPGNGVSVKGSISQQQQQSDFHHGTGHRSRAQSFRDQVRTIKCLGTNIPFFPVRGLKMESNTLACLYIIQRE